MQRIVDMDAARSVTTFRARFPGVDHTSKMQNGHKVHKTDIEAEKAGLFALVQIVSLVDHDMILQALMSHL